MKRIIAVAFGCVLVASACAASTVDTEDQATTEAPGSTAATSTTVGVDATSTTSTTSSTVPVSTTSTTEAPPVDQSEFEALVARMAAASELTSARSEGVIEMLGIDDGSGPVDATIRFGTAFDARTGDGSFLMDMSSLAGLMDADPNDPGMAFAEGLIGEMELRQIGDVAYLKFPIFTALFGAETEWISMPADEGAEFSSGFETVPSDPNDVFDAYEGAPVTVEDLGVERVNGVDATHYRVTFDLTDLVEELSPTERADLAQSGLFADGVVPIELWISEDGHPVRMLFEIDGSGIGGVEGDEFELMRFRYDLLDIGGEVTIDPPPANEVTSIDDLGFGDLSFEG